MDLEDTILNEISKREEEIYCMFSLVCGSQKG
jgi:hypothetical protein